MAQRFRPISVSAVETSSNEGNVSKRRDVEVISVHRVASYAHELKHAVQSTAAIA